MTRKQKQTDSKTAKTAKTTTKRKPVLAVSKSAPPRSRPRVSAKIVVISENDLRQMAYALWESRGRPMGSPEEDWYRAKEQLLSGK